jgi:hypothetical protein
LLVRESLIFQFPRFRERGRIGRALPGLLLLRCLGRFRLSFLGDDSGRHGERRAASKEGRGRVRDRLEYLF